MKTGPRRLTLLLSVVCSGLGICLAWNEKPGMHIDENERRKINYRFKRYASLNVPVNSLMSRSWSLSHVEHKIECIECCSLDFLLCVVSYIVSLKKSIPAQSSFSNAFAPVRYQPKTTTVQQTRDRILLNVHLPDISHQLVQRFYALLRRSHVPRPNISLLVGHRPCPGNGA